MGTRLTHLPLDKTKFRLVPAGYGHVYDDIEFEDPEISNMERLYIECHQTIFRKDPVDRIDGKTIEQVAAIAKNLETSIRLYMLAVMTGHKAHEADITHQTDRGKKLPFRASLLLGKVAEARFKTFSELTAKEFGHFSLSSLSTLLNYNFEKNSPEERMLASEVTVGQFILSYKMGAGGPFYEQLYAECEISLDPLWCAIEPSYKVYILDQYRDQPRGSRVERDHRHTVSRTVGYLKKHKDTAIMAFQAREAVMPRAMKQVLELFGYGLGDFLANDEVFTDCLAFWNYLGMALQHLECLNFVDKGTSRVVRS